MFRIILLSTTLTVTGMAQGLTEPSWTEPFDTAARWAAQPTWLADASPTASVQAADGVVTFEVMEPHRGMKWSAPMPAVPLDAYPYLALRYRAECINTNSTDYLLYLDDRRRAQQLNAIRLCDIRTDGKWHVVAVNLTSLTRATSVYSMAVQVQSDRHGKGRLQLDALAFMARSPDGADVIQRAPTRFHAPDWRPPLREARWTAQPSWLDNPAADGRHGGPVTGPTNRFHVAQPGSGMKWSWSMGETVPLEGHRFASMRYRAGGTAARGDYALCALGSALAGGSAYKALIGNGDILADGRWHTVHVELHDVAEVLSGMDGLAVQVQAGTRDAFLEISDIRLIDAPPPVSLRDAVPWRTGAHFSGCEPITIHAAAAHSMVWREHLRLDGWFEGTNITAHSIPFHLLAGDMDLAATPVRGKTELFFNTNLSCTEVYLLMLTALVGEEEPAYGTGALRAIRDIDRFRLRLEYADGSADTCLPMDVGSGQFGLTEGVQVLVAAADPARRLTRIVLCDRARQGAFAVAAISARTDGTRAFPAVLQNTASLRTKPSTGPSPLEKAIERAAAGRFFEAANPFLTLRVDGRELPAEDFEQLPGATTGKHAYRVRSVTGLRLEVETHADAGDGLAVQVRIENQGHRKHLLDLTAPRIGPYRLSAAASDSYYLVPRRGAILDNRPCAYRERYSGTFPLQFLDSFAPAAGRGLMLLTQDRACLRKHYLLEKQDGCFTMGVAYEGIRLGGGQTFQTARTMLKATDGGWMRGLQAYRRWLQTWHRPQSPRKPWFREVFNFRQRFLWSYDPLYDTGRGVINLERAVTEARQAFGGIDYLHLFDWGNCPGVGRTYGRTGDPSPYDHLAGGREALRDAIAGVQAQGVPVGIYIEGYLLEKRGTLGRAHGRTWQLVNREGQGMYWPDSTEMFICPAVAAWREIQASTYENKLRDLGIDGMYIDQFGFANPGKDCWSPDHGHAVPGNPVVTERDATRLLRGRIEAVRPGVALYTEETPVDVTTAYQDGSFTYAMLNARQAAARVPLNLARFAIPDFKTIEILFCDKPTGSWATGVKWVFFNGEAIWLEGPANTWFEPETRQAIRRCYAILREHRDAFTGSDPEPLVPTELGGVYANAFHAAGKTVYTLYNSRYRTLRGTMLHVPHRAGATYRDAWNGRPLVPRLETDDAFLDLELGPRDVGCVVVTRPGAKRSIPVR